MVGNNKCGFSKRIACKNGLKSKFMAFYFDTYIWYICLLNGACYLLDHFRLLVIGWSFFLVFSVGNEKKYILSFKI